MASFCTKCGAPLGAGPFCVNCGTKTGNVATPAQQPMQTPATATPMQSAPVAAPSTAVAQNTTVTQKKMSPLAKLGIAAVVIIFVGGALAIGGVYYVAHRVSQKIHQEAGSLLGSTSDSENSNSTGGSSSASNSLGDVCRFLSKEDVSTAIGVEIIRTQTVDNNGCSYIAKGTQADMMAKHTTAMMAARGADKKTQQMMQTIAGGMFKTFQSEDKDRTPDTGEIAVFNFSIDENAAEEQMRLNAKMLGTLGDSEGLPGIGDQAFVSADGMIMVRKGKKLVRIMFMTCPCGTEAVKPLAKEIADAL
jgi:hypothetical protein